MPKYTLPQPGDTLDNGAIVIASIAVDSERSYVLAIRPDHKEYVTWFYTPKIQTVKGNYFYYGSPEKADGPKAQSLALSGAIEDLKRRAEI